MNGKDGNVERKGRKIGPEIHCADLKLSRNLSAHVRKSGVDEVTMMHGWIIRYLYENREQDIFQKDIEQRFAVGRSTVTNLLQLMEKKGFVRRESVKQDARLKKVILTEKGIAQDRLYKEDRSTSTRENLLYSKKIIEEKNLDPQVIIVTNEFHEYRASVIAEHTGIKPSAVCGKTAWWLLPTYYLRELYGIVFEWIF